MDKVRHVYAARNTSGHTITILIVISSDYDRFTFVDCDFIIVLYMFCLLYTSTSVNVLCNSLSNANMRKSKK